MSGAPVWLSATLAALAASPISSPASTTTSTAASSGTAGVAASSVVSAERRHLRLVLWCESRLGFVQVGGRLRHCPYGRHVDRFVGEKNLVRVFKNGLVSILIKWSVANVSINIGREFHGLNR